MKNFKFRAWDEENDKMIEWHDEFFYDTSKVTGYSGYMDCIDLPLMQFTGLYDKDETEIYVGDIIQLNFNDFTLKGIVKNEPPCFLLETVYDNKVTKMAMNPKEMKKQKVVGNIFKNSEEYIKGD